MKIARVFPRVTKATPKDEYTFFTEEPPLLIMPEVDEVHISCTFTIKSILFKSNSKNERR